MAQTHNQTTRPNQSSSLSIPMLMGAGIALLVISFFVFGAKTPPAEWGKFWMVRPLIVTPLAGATGGAFYHFMDALSNKGKINRIVAIVVSLVVFLIGLWMGIVLGLAGTMWN